MSGSLVVYVCLLKVLKDTAHDVYACWTYSPGNDDFLTYITTCTKKLQSCLVLTVVFFHANTDVTDSNQPFLNISHWKREAGGET